MCDFHKIQVDSALEGTHAETISFAWKSYYENQILYDIGTVDNRGQLMTNLNKLLKSAYENGGITIGQLDVELQTKIALIKRPSAGAKSSAKM